MASTYEPIASHTLASNATSYTFTSIPSTYTDLVLVAVGESTRTDSSRGTQIRVGNNTIDTGSNYSNTTLQGNGSTTASYRVSSGDRIYDFESGRSGFGDVVNVARFMSYANTNVFKTVLMSSDNANNLILRTSALWRSTSAIDRIQILVAVNELKAGYTFSLYGIKAA